MTEQKVILDKIKLKYKFIDLIFGTHSINDFPKLFFESLEKKQKNSKDVIYIENKNEKLEKHCVYALFQLFFFVWLLIIHRGYAYYEVYQQVLR